MILGHSAGVAADQAIAQRSSVQAINRAELCSALLAERQVIDLPR